MSDDKDDDNVVPFLTKEEQGEADSLTSDIMEVVQSDRWVLVGINDDGTLNLVSSTQDGIERMGILAAATIAMTMDEEI